MGQHQPGVERRVLWGRQGEGAGGGAGGGGGGGGGESPADGPLRGPGGGSAVPAAEGVVLPRRAAAVPGGVVVRVGPQGGRAQAAAAAADADADADAAAARLRHLRTDEDGDRRQDGAGLRGARTAGASSAPSDTVI